jgi:hypothetical protein
LDLAIEWEGVAREVHDATGIDAPVDAFDIAGAYGLRCLPGGHDGAFLDGDDIHYDSRARSVRQHGLVSHELGHWFLRAAKLDDTDEQAVGRVAAALMLPWATFDRHLKQKAWDLYALRELHPNASAEMIARRISQMRDALVTVFDQGKVSKRLASPWLPTPDRKPMTIEAKLAAAALESGEPQHAGDLLGAYPFIDGEHRRVIVVADAEQLSLQLQSEAHGLKGLVYLR